MDPGDLSLEELLPLWLAKYGGVFRLDHRDETFFYRRLSRREYRLAQMIEELDERYDQIAETCLLWPQHWKAEDHQGDLAGVIEAIGVSILRDSGCFDLKATKTRYEEQIASNVEAQFESVVEHIFGGSGNFDRYQDWSYDQLFDAYTRAKWISENILGRPIVEQKKEPEKRGRRPDGAAERPAIPDIDSGQMGLRPMSEVIEKNRQARRTQAIRNLGQSVTPTPVRVPQN